MLRRILPITLALAVAAGAYIAGPASAAPGGRSGGKGGGSSTIVLVLLDPTDGVANHGDGITFDVSTTATTTPLVSLLCYQGSALVFQGYAGYWDTYPYDSDFTLQSAAWTGGAADCHARLYYSRDGRRTITLATLDFPVAA